ncbi:MAG: HEAT repeat domain-containing protein [Pseudomonadota bacterium]|nr:HEAT repeat domain-containing protein [Pseudomonadota bacterium]
MTQAMQQLAMTYRGQATALLGQPDQIVLTTQHIEGLPTAVYRIQTDSAALQINVQALPCGVTACTQLADQLWLAGSDGQLYQTDLSGQQAVHAHPLPSLDIEQGQAPILAITVLANQYLVLLQAQRLSWFDPQTSRLQHLPLDQSATVCASSDDGQWLVVGFASGQIASFFWQDDQLQPSAQAEIHQGAVTALCFAHQQQRFYSAGQDRKLYSTHVQGELQALDKGKNSNHTGVIHALLSTPDRLYSAADDQSVKSWPEAGGQPNTCKQNLVSMRQIALNHWQDKPCVVVTGTDHSLRWIALDTEGKLGDVLLVVRDGYHWAKYTFDDQQHPEEMPRAIALLQQYDDQPAIQQLEQTLNQSKDKALRLKLTDALIQAKHPKANLAVFKLLKDKQHAEVRETAFNALQARAHLAIDPLQHVIDALATGDLALGRLALNALALSAQQPQAPQHKRAEQLLIHALQQHPQDEVQALALHLLEGCYPADQPRASLLALASANVFTQRAGLIRLYQRDLLTLPTVKPQILRLQQHADHRLRHTAFWVAVLAQPRLAEALQVRDHAFTRPIRELANFVLIADQYRNATPSSDPKSEQKPEKNQPIRPSAAVGVDVAPLLYAMVSPYADLSLAASYALALFEDQRAFGLLMQLAQEKDADIRRGVAQALAYLKLSEATPILLSLLHDRDSMVRDQAFSSLAQIETDALTWIEHGLQSPHEDIHRRALKRLLELLAAQPHDPAALQQLQQVLNDPHAAIRAEAMKACLNRQLSGSAELSLAATLRLLLSSQHADVHQEALNEWMAKPNDPSSAALLSLLLDDPFASIRQQTLSFALKEKKRFDKLAVLTAATQSSFVDTRRAGLQEILRQPLAQFQPLLVARLADPQAELRAEALHALVALDQAAPLEQALSSPFADIQLAAAQVCAKHGDMRAATVFEQFLTAQRPETAAEQALWQQRVLAALEGLATLSAADYFEQVLAWVQPNSIDQRGQSIDAEIATQAAKTLPWLSQPKHAEDLAALLTDERALVRQRAALGLALLGDQRALTVLDDPKQQAGFSSVERRLAYLNLGRITSAFVVTGTQSEQALCISQWLLMFAQDLLQAPYNAPLSRLALAQANLPNSQPLQFQAAGFLSVAADPTQRWQYLLDELNQAVEFTDQADRWTFGLTDLQGLLAMLLYGEQPAQARLWQLVQRLDDGISYPKWLAAYRVYQQRYAAALAQAWQRAQPALQQQPNTAQQTEWQTMAFGSYVGLIRNKATPLNLRQRAMTRLLQLAQQQPALNAGSQLVLTTLLDHSTQKIRLQAFDALIALGMPSAALAELATDSQYTDVQQHGMQLLLSELEPAQAQQRLLNLLQTENATLAEQVWQVLCKQLGLAEAAPAALQANVRPLRRQVLRELSADSNLLAQQPALLFSAINNDDRETAYLAGRLLVEQQHPQALGALQQLFLGSSRDTEQAQLLQLTRKLPQDAAANWLLSMLDNPQRLVKPEQIYQWLGQMRRAVVAPALLAQLSLPQAKRKAIRDALLMISGHDQPILDPDDQLADQTWLARQHPRDNQLLIDLFTRLINLQESALAAALLPALTWLKTPAADSALLSASSKINAEQLPNLIRSIGQRAEKRQGNPQALRQHLAHKQPDIQFLAAEGLARAGHAEGLSVLLAAIDYQDRLALRIRAVQALGMLADQRAFDRLLKLAQEDGHALQAAAIEALGQLGNGEHAQKILKILQSQLANTAIYDSRYLSILRGLRWLNHLDAWRLIHQTIEQHCQQDESCAEAIRLLQHGDSPASRDVLLQILRHSQDEDNLHAAYQTAQQLWGCANDQTYPYDEAYLQGFAPDFEPFDLEQAEPLSLKRVVQHASTAQLLHLLSGQLASDAETQAKIRAQLRQALLQRREVTDQQILTTLQQSDATLVEIAAHWLAQKTNLNPILSTGLAERLSQSIADWQQLEQQSHLPTATAQTQRDLLDQQTALQALLWSLVIHRQPHPAVGLLLGQTDSATQGLWSKWRTQIQQMFSASTQEISALISQKIYAPLQQTLLMGMLTQRADHSTVGLPEPWLDWVNHFAQQQVAELRELAQSVLQQHQPQHRAKQQGDLAQLDLQQPEQRLHAMQQLEQQARVLPELIAVQDVSTLQQIAQDAQLADHVRLGAIEGLAKIPTTAAQQALQQLSRGLAPADEDLQSAAYRALRRLGRWMDKQKTKSSTTGASV